MTLVLAYKYMCCRYFCQEPFHFFLWKGFLKMAIKFVSIPGSVLADRGLSATAKLLYGLLRWHQYDNAECWLACSLCLPPVGRVTCQNTLHLLPVFSQLILAKGLYPPNKNSYYFQGFYVAYGLV